MTKKVALITGVTGQDGSYLAELLLDKGYEVHGTVRRASTDNTERIAHLNDQINDIEKVHLHHADLMEAPALRRLIFDIKPDEIYNLAAQSHVGVSFKIPEFTFEANVMGQLYLLEIARDLNEKKQVKFYQASSSEMFGKVREVPQTEETPFHPRSPYAVTKVTSHWLNVNYRESFDMFCCNGILFNHESPRRGLNFVTRKVTHQLARVKLGKQKVLKLGNMDAKRDWGYAKEYVEAMYLMLQAKKPDDYVVATGETHTVREFVEETAKYLDFDLEWKGEGVNEKGVDKKSGKTIVEIDPQFFRPAEVDLLIGDASKAKKVLKWEPKVAFKELAKIMAESDFELAKKS